MNTYLVVRPYCTPSQVVVIAASEDAAVKIVGNEFGYCSNTKATLKESKGIILSK